MTEKQLRFVDILDDCLDATRHRGASPEECLALYPGYRDELQPLLSLATRLESAAGLQAPEGFRRIASARMINLIAAHPRQPSQACPGSSWIQQQAGGWRSVWRHAIRGLPSWLIAGLLVVVALASAAGLVSASGHSLPGDALYLLKTAIEQLQLFASTLGAAEADLRLDLANRRMDELSALIGQNRPGDMQQPLLEYQTQLEAGLALLEQDGRLSQRQRVELANAMLNELALHETLLNRFMSQVTAQYQLAMQETLAAVHRTRLRALRIARSRTPSPVVTPQFTTAIPAGNTTVGPYPSQFITPGPERTPFEGPDRTPHTGQPDPPQMPTHWYGESPSGWHTPQTTPGPYRPSETQSAPVDRWLSPPGPVDSPESPPGEPPVRERPGPPGWPPRGP